MTMKTLVTDITQIQDLEKRNIESVGDCCQHFYIGVPPIPSLVPLNDSLGDESLTLGTPLTC